MSIAAVRRLAVSIGMAASLAATAVVAVGAARAQVLGTPPHVSTATGLSYHDNSHANAVDTAFAEMRRAIARCDRRAYDLALQRIQNALSTIRSETAMPAPPGSEVERGRKRADADRLNEAATRRPPYPDPCTPQATVPSGIPPQTTAERLEALTTITPQPLDVVGQAGFPGVDVPGTSGAVYDTRIAQRAGEIIARAKRAAAACDAAALEQAMKDYSALMGEAAIIPTGASAEQIAQRRVTFDILGRLYQSDFPKKIDCPKPAGQAATPPATTPTPGTTPTPAPGTPRATPGLGTPPPGATMDPGAPAPAQTPPDRRTGMLPGGPMFEVAAVVSGFHPARGGSNVTGFDDLAGPDSLHVHNSITAPYHAIGLSGRLYLYDLFTNGGPPGPLGGLGVFGEAGVDFFFGRSHVAAFQGVNTFPQGFGEHIQRAIWAVNVAIGIAIPIGVSPFMDGVYVSSAAGDGGQPDACTGGACAVPRNVMLDLYVGAAITNRTHKLQGNEAGAGPGALPFYAETNRTTIDPKVGLGVRVPFAVGDGPAMFFGLNGELIWRPGSVVTAPSRNFPSQTYYGTIDPWVDFSVSARLGVSF
jgi:hypothetical protein